MIFSDIKPGTKVRIVRGVGKHADKNGLIAEYEGDFPMGAIIRWLGAWKEYDYANFMANEGDKQILHTDEAHKQHPEWFKDDGISEDAIFWFEDTNPRFILPDGTRIWGAECWWEEYQPGKPLEEAEVELDEHLEMLRVVAVGLSAKETP